VFCKVESIMTDRLMQQIDVSENEEQRRAYYDDLKPEMAPSSKEFVHKFWTKVLGHPLIFLLLSLVLFILAKG